jgi:hypothetical protein
VLPRRQALLGDHLEEEYQNGAEKVKNQKEGFPKGTLEVRMEHVDLMRNEDKELNRNDAN